MAQRNPRRSSILKTRNSIGVGDETKTIDIFPPDPNNQSNSNITGNLAFPKRRVSFSAQPQIREIPNTFEENNENKTFMGFEDMEVTFCENQVEHPTPETQTRVEMRAIESYGNKTMIEFVDMEETYCENPFEPPPRVRAEESLISQIPKNIVESNGNKTVLEFVDMEVTFCKDQFGEIPTHDIPVTNPPNIANSYAPQPQNVNKTVLVNADMEVTFCENQLDLPPHKTQQNKTVLDNADMEVSFCENQPEPEPQTQNINKTVLVNADMEVSFCENQPEPQTQNINKTVLVNADMEVSFCENQPEPEPQTQNINKTVLDKGVEQFGKIPTHDEVVHHRKPVTNPPKIAISYGSRQCETGDPKTNFLLRNPLVTSSVTRPYAKPTSSHFGQFSNAKTPIRFPVRQMLPLRRPTVMTAEIQTSPMPREEKSYPPPPQLSSVEVQTSPMLALARGISTTTEVQTSPMIMLPQQQQQRISDPHLSSPEIMLQGQRKITHNTTSHISTVEFQASPTIKLPPSDSSASNLSTAEVQTSPILPLGISATTLESEQGILEATNSEIQTSPMPREEDKIYPHPQPPTVEVQKFSMPPPARGISTTTSESELRILETRNPNYKTTLANSSTTSELGVLGNSTRNLNTTYSSEAGIWENTNQNLTAVQANAHSSTTSSEQGILETTNPFFHESYEGGETPDTYTGYDDDDVLIGPNTEYYLQNHEGLRGVGKVGALEALRNECLLLDREEFEALYKYFEKLEDQAFSQTFLQTLKRRFELQKLMDLPLEEQWKRNSRFSAQMKKQNGNQAREPTAADIAKIRSYNYSMLS